MTRPSRALPGMVGVAAAALLLAGCSGDPAPAQPSPTGLVATQCREVMAALPEQVMGQQRTRVDGNLAVWGDPAITLRCGVDKPAGLDATSPCDELNGVGWFSEEPGTALRKAWRFTTIGRQGFVEVVVPERYEPAGDALMDLSDAVATMPMVKPCQ